MSTVGIAVGMIISAGITFNHSVFHHPESYVPAYQSVSVFYQPTKAFLFILLVSSQRVFNPGALLTSFT
jgi:hypothetical protein